jgi:tRNA A37 threonylcarbamoyladenosine synthetase subunit TsaC/SUA5/YrdC
LKDKDGAVVKDLAKISSAHKKLITIAIDNGEIKSGKSTTLLNCMNQQFKVEREGAITAWELKKVVSEVKEN